MMVEEVKMGDSLQVQFDDTGDYFVLLWRDKFGRVHITGPGTFHSADLIVLNSVPKPPSPPAEMPECRDCGGSGKINDGAGPTDWVTCPNCHGEGKFPYPEMPKVDPRPPESNPSAPLTYGKCILFYEAMGDKKARSCEGCKIAGCAAKGRTS